MTDISKEGLENMLKKLDFSSESTEDLILLLEDHRTQLSKLVKHKDIPKKLIERHNLFIEFNCRCIEIISKELDLRGAQQ